MKTTLLHFFLTGLVVFMINPYLSGQSNLEPVHFQQVGGDPNERVWDIFIFNAHIGGVTLVPGDEIAIFDGYRIVGVLVLEMIPSYENLYDCMLRAYSTMAAGIGFQPGDTVIYKVWQASINMETVICNPIYNNEFGDAWDQNIFPFLDNQYSMVDLSCEPGDCSDPTYAYAGTDASVCGTDPFYAPEAYTSNCDQMLWTTNGTGFFNNNTILRPTYTPGEEDVTAGMVTLSLTSSRPGYNSASDNLELTINKYPDPAGSISGESSVCRGETVVYTTVPVANSNYLYWFILPYYAGQVTNNGTECTVLFDPVFTGTAILKVYGENNCGPGSFSDDFLITVMNCTNVNENTLNDIINIRPNPASEKINISLPANFSTSYTIQITDCFGKQVKKIRSVEHKNELNIDIEALFPGIYLVVLTNEKSINCQKFVVAR